MLAERMPYSPLFMHPVDRDATPTQIVEVPLLEMGKLSRELNDLIAAPHKLLGTK